MSHPPRQDHRPPLPCLSHLQRSKRSNRGKHLLRLAISFATRLHIISNSSLSANVLQQVTSSSQLQAKTCCDDFVSVLCACCWGLPEDQPRAWRRSGMRFFLFARPLHVLHYCNVFAGARRAARRRCGSQRHDVLCCAHSCNLHTRSNAIAQFQRFNPHYLCYL